MMEPLSVAVHAIANVGALRTGQSVLIFGAGPVGLLAMAVAKGLGASRIVAVDINEERLNFAKGYAATDVYVPVCSLFLRVRLRAAVGDEVGALGMEGWRESAGGR